MIIYIGPNFSETIIRNYRATSPAAAQWSGNFLKYLAKNHSIRSVFYINNFLFPKGKLCIKKKRFFHHVDSITVTSVGLPCIRERLIVKNVIAELETDISDIKLIITYNSSSINLKIGDYFKSKGVKWLMIYADADKSSQQSSNADFNVFFSYYDYLNSSLINKFQFEGGIYNKINFEYTPTRDKIFLYTGVVRRENGLELMIESFKRTSDPFSQLIICGRGMYSGFNKSICKDKRIKYLGLVSYDQLLSLYREAFCFVNPRLSKYEENNHNFPSKLLDYFSYGKPIISTMTKGINPIYLEYMFVPKKENEIEFMNVFNQVIELTEFDRNRIFFKMKHFVNELYSFERRVNDFVDWLNMSDS